MTYLTGAEGEGRREGRRGGTEARPAGQRRAAASGRQGHLPPPMGVAFPSCQLLPRVRDSQELFSSPCAVSCSHTFCRCVGAEPAAQPSSAETRNHTHTHTQHAPPATKHNTPTMLRQGLSGGPALRRRGVPELQGTGLALRHATAAQRGARCAAGMGHPKKPGTRSSLNTPVCLCIVLFFFFFFWCSGMPSRASRSLSSASLTEWRPPPPASSKEPVLLIAGAAALEATRRPRSLKTARPSSRPSPSARPSSRP